MSKVIAYGTCDGKLWFGRPTLWSWVRSFFVKGALLTVKPYRGYEEYAYYKGFLRISPQFAKFTNHGCLDNPLSAVLYTERNNLTGPLVPWQK